MTTDEECDDMSNAGSRILRSVERARAYARGEATEGFVAHVPSDVDVKAIRTKLGLSQDSFGLRFGFSPAAVRDWEQHRRQPEQAARVLLMVIDRNVDAVYDALKSVADRPTTKAASSSRGSVRPARKAPRRSKELERA
jgi:putative transcriptional regulator